MEVVALSRVVEETVGEGWWDLVVRWLITVVRQSTMVPKTSVRMALGGVLRDISCVNVVWEI